jgi:hypothetical protein
MTAVSCPRCGSKVSGGTPASACPRCHAHPPRRAEEGISRHSPLPDSDKWPPENPPTTSEEPFNSYGSSKPQKAHRELLLRFACASCRASLTVPLRSLGIEEKCPGCKESLVTPTLDDQVVGWEAILQSLGSPKPRPRSRAQAPAHRDVAAPPQSAATNSPIPPPLVSPPDGKRQPSPTPPPAAASSTAASPSKRDTASPFFRTKPDAAQERVEAVEAVVVPTPTKSPALPSPRGPNLSPRLMSYVVYYALWLGPFLASALIFFLGVLITNRNRGMHGLAAATGGCCCLGHVWLLGGWWIARLCTPFVMAALYGSIRCPGCGEAHPAISRWSCGCGYKDHRDRNFFLFRCPKCGNRFGHFDCPVCDVTILC